jgi:DNA-binding winged helix-turn-helix (wHTH) protein
MRPILVSTQFDKPIGLDSVDRKGKRTVRFGAFEAVLPSGEVRKSGSRIKLPDQPCKVLQILLEHRGDLVTRKELQSSIWPEDSFGDFDHAGIQAHASGTSRSRQPPNGSDFTGHPTRTAKHPRTRVKVSPPSSTPLRQ